MNISILTCFSFVVWDACTDFSLALFPALILSSTNMQMRLKLGLIALMGLGVLFVVSLLALNRVTHRLSSLAPVYAPS